MTYTHSDFRYIDMHTHFFPPKLFQAIWTFFERTDHEGNVQGWPIAYKLPNQELIEFLHSKQVDHFTTYNYAHKEGVAKVMNDWTYQFVQDLPHAIPFGTVWPGDEDRSEYVTQLFDEYGFEGIKVQPLVQDFYAHDERMHEVYDIIVDRAKWYTIHAGTAPYRNKYVGFKHFKKFIEHYPNMKVIVAHLGAFEYKKFLGLLDTYENLYLDTAMVFIPNNIFPERKIKRPDKEFLLSYEDRLLFGSDFPNIPYEYERSTRGFLEMDLPKRFYKKLFYENAKRLFNL